VDLPDPEVPTITVIEPRAMDMDTPSTTVADPYRFVKPSISIIGPTD
jgi:hypothetical protein